MDFCLSALIVLPIATTVVEVHFVKFYRPILQYLVARRTVLATFTLLIGVVLFLLLLTTSGNSEVKLSRVYVSPLLSTAPKLITDIPDQRSVDSYYGLGAWVDSFDADPAYARSAPTVHPADVADMDEYGVRTLFLQASRDNDRSGMLISDPWILTNFLLSSHQYGLNVIAWYLPKWVGDEDLERLVALHEFEVLGHRFDGLAVDIEWTGGDLSHEERSSRLLELSARLEVIVGDDPLGAIVMPPVLTDEINLDFWPEFPWERIRPHFDVWLPMSYWSFRTEEHADPLYYSGESIRLLRSNLKSPNALVHGIGGVGSTDGTYLPNPGEPMASINDLEGFTTSLKETGSIGGSIYDWATTGRHARRQLNALFISVFPDLEAN